MIRKTVIVVMTLAAIGTAVAYVVSYKNTIHWAGDLTSHRHVCIEAVQGSVYLHYVYSDIESVLWSIDRHEHGGRVRPRTGFVTYGEQDPSYVADPVGPPPDPAYVPTITYAWSKRIGLPMWLPLTLFVLYPAITVARKHSLRQMLGFDLRIKRTTARMGVATLVGTILVLVGHLPGSFFGFYWLHDVHGAPMWVVIPIVIAVSFSPIIYITLWLFWRLTPGKHGGPLWRRRQRLLRERGLCLNCAYDLTGNVSGVCPKSGTEIPEE